MVITSSKTCHCSEALELSNHLYSMILALGENRYIVTVRVLSIKETLSHEFLPALTESSEVITDHPKGPGVNYLRDNDWLIMRLIRTCHDFSEPTYSCKSMSSRCPNRKMPPTHLSLHQKLGVTLSLSGQT